MTIVPKEIEIGKCFAVGGMNPFFLIAGPCVIESEEHAFQMASEIGLICDQERIPFIFKASFDKANRSSRNSFRGPGLKEGLRILGLIRKELDIPVLSDIHEPGQAEAAGEVLDVIQIPAFLCRQTDLLIAAAKTGKPVNVKKGQFLAPEDMIQVADKILSQGNETLIFTERGTSFGYHNLVFDVRSIPIMKEQGFPVVIDASHSVQRPGGLGFSSGGDARFIPHIARAGIAAGADGLFLEAHTEPEKALSDKHNTLKIKELQPLLKQLRIFHKAVRTAKC